MKENSFECSLHQVQVDWIRQFSPLQVWLKQVRTYFPPLVWQGQVQVLDRCVPLCRTRILIIFDFLTFSGKGERGLFFFPFTTPFIGWTDGGESTEGSFSVGEEWSTWIEQKIRTCQLINIQQTKLLLLKKYSSFFASLLADFSFPFHRDCMETCGRKRNNLLLFFERVEVR